jgi:hypothetical protein
LKHTPTRSVGTRRRGGAVALSRLLRDRQDSTLCHSFSTADGAIGVWTAVRLRGADGAITMATVVPAAVDVAAGGKVEVPRSTSRKEAVKFLAGRGPTS